MTEVVEGVVVVGVSPEEVAVEAMAEEAEAMVGAEAEEVIPQPLLHSHHSVYAPMPVLFWIEHMEFIASIASR